VEFAPRLRGKKPFYLRILAKKATILLESSKKVGPKDIENQHLAKKLIRTSEF
jgi:hypothetical protein